MTKTPGQRASRRNQKRVSGAVRNILCNELGLSKAAILKDIHGEVRSTIQNHIGNSMNLDAMLMSLVSAVVYGKYNGGRLQKLVEDQVEAEIKRQVDTLVKSKLEGKLVISITEKEDVNYVNP